MPKILVVGGGLAGIAASLALRRAGHTVQVSQSMMDSIAWFDRLI